MNHSASGAPSIAIVVSGWPRVSETFALNELVALHRRGMLVRLFATKPGDDSLLQPGVGELEPAVELLGTGPAAAQAAQAVASLVERGIRVDAVHGYFAHQPADVAERMAAELGVPFGFSVHALDARKVEPAELGRRAAAASLVLACNADVAEAIRAVGTEPTVLSHGVDLDRFTPDRPAGSRPGGVVELLAVGRLVEKKGFVHLIDALAATPDACRLTIVGDGPDRELLGERARRLGVGDRVRFLGRRTHDDLPDLYRSADIVVVPSVVDRNGDRDGLPNVVLEAMAAGRAIVASRVAAVPSAIVAGGAADDTGVLVAPADVASLADAITRLVDDPERRERLGANARRRAERDFALDRCSAACADAIAAAYAPRTELAGRHHA